MPNPSWQLLFADDDSKMCEQVKDYLEGASLETGSDGLLVIETLTDFDNVIGKLEERHIDLLVLDVRLQLNRQTTPAEQEEAGERILREVRQQRFVPVIFYTGLPNLVRHLTSPLVRVVEKTEGLEKLLDTINEVFATNLPQVNRALVRHLEAVQRDYMWDFVADNWQGFIEEDDRTSLAYLLARRLATSLSGPGIRQFAMDLGDTVASFIDENKVHPMQYYVLPPVAEQQPQVGDIYQGKVGGQEGYWILLTPSCDLVRGREKAEWVTFAFCESLENLPEFEKWKAALSDQSNNSEDRLRSLLRDNRHGYQAERFYFLPGVLVLPHLLADFQQLRNLPLGQLCKLEHKASLDSPFAEALLARFARYFGRLGTPDLDVDGLIARLKVETNAAGTP